jgi:hypothetical protein
MSNQLSQIEALCNTRGFATDDLSAFQLVVSDRGCGNGTDCEIDPVVVSRAKALRLEIHEQFGPQVFVGFDTCDEWVSVIIALKQEAA